MKGFQRRGEFSPQNRIAPLSNFAVMIKVKRFTFLLVPSWMDFRLGQGGGGGGRGKPCWGLVCLFACIFRWAQEIITVEKSFVNPVPLS